MKFRLFTFQIGVLLYVLGLMLIIAWPIFLLTTIIFLLLAKQEGCFNDLNKEDYSSDRFFIYVIGPANNTSPGSEYLNGIESKLGSKFIPVAAGRLPKGMKVRR